MVRVWLGRSLRVVTLELLNTPGFMELVKYIANRDVDIEELRIQIDKINKSLAWRGMRIQIKRAHPLDKKADYRLVLVKTKKDVST
jgi:hypothetical protein